MRSDLIFGAAHHIPNRYLLVRALAKAARALHKPGTRIQDTMNDVLLRFAGGNSIAAHDAIPGSAAAPERSRKPQAPKPGSLKLAKVSVIREAPKPKAFKARDHRKRA